MTEDKMPKFEADKVEQVPDAMIANRMTVTLCDGCDRVHLTLYQGDRLIASAALGNPFDIAQNIVDAAHDALMRTNITRAVQ